MEVRPVDFVDLNQVLGLIDLFNRPMSPRPDNDELVDIARMIKDTGGEVIGAFIRDCIVGTCTLNLCPNLSWSGRPYAIIENVIVAPQYRNQGIGKELLRYAIELAKSKRCYKVALMTGSQRKSTLKFYESAGFSADKTGFQIRFDA